MTPLRAVFMGTPAFAATILEHLLDAPCVTVSAVYTQPDRPAGRGKALKAPAVKELALAHTLPVYQPLNFKDDFAVAELEALAPDVLLVAAYGLILPERVLRIPRLLPINVHASLLPKYRGAAPVQRAIMDGCTVTGVTIMHMEAGLDTGPILLQQAMGIDINDTSATLLHDLAQAGAELLVSALEKLMQGSLQPISQNGTLATHAAKLTKNEGLLDFTESVQCLHARIRGVTPWPGASFFLHRAGAEPLAVHCGPGKYPFQGEVPFSGNPRPGDVGGLVDDALLIYCADGWYAFTALKPAGKKVIDGRAFYNGYCAGQDGLYAGVERL